MESPVNSINLRQTDRISLGREGLVDRTLHTWHCPNNLFLLSLPLPASYIHVQFKAMQIPFVDDFATSIGVTTSQLRLILLLYVALPLSFVFPYLPPSTVSPLPALFALIPSFFFLCVVLDLWQGAFELLAVSVVTWIIVKIGRKSWGSGMPWAVFAVVMGHLTYNNVQTYRNGTSRDVIDIAGSQMVLVMKLTSFAWSAYDGGRPISELDQTQKQSSLVEIPSLLNFLGYCFFFPSILAGPSFTYSSYSSFTSHQLFIKETSSSSTTEPRKKGAALVPAGRRRKALKRAFLGTVFLAIYAVWSGTASYENMLKPEFGKRSWGFKFLFMNFGGFIARTKYYAVWCVAESSFILSGLGYNPMTKKYDASRNVRIRSIEFAPNFKILLDSWNVNTNVWLRENIYKRVAKKGKKPGFKSTQITFITSALWHGVNPCYLMTFVLGGLNQSLARTLRRSLRPFFLPPSPPPSTSTGYVPLSPSAPPQSLLKWIYDIAGILATQIVLNFAVAPFMLLSVESSLKAWGSVNWYGIWGVLIPMIVLGFGGRKELDRRIKLRNLRAAKGKVEEKEEKEETRRVEWEEKMEQKRKLRGEEGVASLGMDVEELVREEEGEEEEGKELRAKKEL